MTKIPWLPIISLFLVPNVQAVSSNLTPFTARLGALKIEYRLPSGAHYLAGKPISEIEFPAYREYPLSGGIVSIGWSFIKDVPQVQLSLAIMKIEKPRFDSSTASSEWVRILQEERMSFPLPGERTRIICDNLQREWLETVVETKNLISDRSYVRPIAPDLVFLLTLNLGDRATEKQRAEALQIQDKIFQTIVITKS